MKVKLEVGDRIESNSCGIYTIIEKSAGYCVIKFDTGYVCTTDIRSARIGRVKDPLYPQVFGIGYLGVGTYIARLGSQSKGYNSLREYNAWINMMQRCYYNKYESRVQGCLTYESIEVSPIWHNFQNFAEWYVPRREVFDKTGIKRPSLDKDILAIPTQDKIYSPDTCCLVPIEINGAMIGIDKIDSGILKQLNGYVVYHKSKKASEHFDTIEEAIEVRKVIKQEHFTNLANKYQHVIEPKVYDKLCNWFNLK